MAHHSFRWCPVFTWGAKRHLHKCCMTDQHILRGLREHFCSCGAVWS